LHIKVYCGRLVYMKLNNKTWINDEGKSARIGYCPYHPTTKLDGGAECPECEKEIMNYGKTK
jgi:hypothetical protein